MVHYLCLKNYIGEFDTSLKIKIDRDQIAAFCEKWNIVEFSIFGSVLRDDFQPDSDIDILVTFGEESNWSLFDWVDMIDELKQIFGREVDLISSKGLRNPFRRREIYSTREIIYVA